MTEATKKLVLAGLSRLGGDDYARAQRAFGKMSEQELDQEWGSSGKTCRYWLNYHKERNDKIESAIQEVKKFHLDKFSRRK